MVNPQIPNFGELLAPYLGSVSAEALPFLLSQLERTAAARYRGWAEEVTDHRASLLACAEREDEIADRVERLLPPSSADRDLVLGVMPQAKETYYSVFEGLSAIDQMSIQAKAERQGAGAWQGLKTAYPQLADDLDELSTIELQSADCLDQVLVALASDQ
jgi:hypothetical protein